LPVKYAPAGGRSPKDPVATAEGKRPKGHRHTLLRSRRRSSWRSTRRQGSRPSAATTTSTAATSPTPAPSA